MSANTQSLEERTVKLLEAIQRVEKARNTEGVSLFQVNDLASRGANLIHSALGARSVYAENMRNAMKHKTPTACFFAVAGVLQAFHLDLAHGHLVNIRHEVEAVVVSEILTQARTLLSKKGVHPATVVIVACAGVEEFLRNWCEEKGIKIPERQRSIGKYAVELRLAGHIELPVERRVTSWADYRNSAAHGSDWSKITSEVASRVLTEIESFVLEYRTVLG